jgi:ATP-dependent protease ClpP protease subunit
LSYVLEELKLAAGKPLTVQVSSIGGDVETGVGIRNALVAYMEQHKVDVTFDFLGWAQSSASYVATIPGAKVKAHPNTLYMMHNPSGGAFGDYRAMEARLAWLKPVTENFRNAYTAKSGNTLAEVTAQLDAETYLMGQEIVDAGYADELVEEGALFAIGDKKSLIEQAKKEQDRLRIAAMGGHNNNVQTPSKVPAEETIIMEPTPEQIAAAAAAKDKAVAEATAAATARATAYGEALQKLPVTMQADVQKSFEAGEPASYFKGLVASANMLADAQSKKDEAAAHAAAQGEQTPGVVATPGDGQPAPAAAVSKASGETGKIVEVG